jgi:hypothetical protein
MVMYRAKYYFDFFVAVLLQDFQQYVVLATTVAP